MPEIENPVTPGVNEKAVLVARRNQLMSEILKIASSPALTPPVEERVFVERKPEKIVRHLSPETKIKRMVNRDMKVEKPDAFADNPQLLTVRGVHIDLYDYFSLNADRVEEGDLKKLSYIHGWASSSSKNFREALKKLNSIDNRLGSADVGTAKLAKLYNWLRLRDGNTKT